MSTDYKETLGRMRSSDGGVTAPFAGLVKCADCNHAMTQAGGYYTLVDGTRVRRGGSYDCVAHRQSGDTACPTHYISAKALMKVVTNDIRFLAGVITADEDKARQMFLDKKELAYGNALRSDQHSLKKTQKRLAELDKLIAAAFEKTVLGGENSAMFTQLAANYEAEKKGITQRITSLEQSIYQHTRVENDVNSLNFFPGKLRVY